MGAYSGGRIEHHTFFWLDSIKKIQLMLDAINALGNDSHFAFSLGLTGELGTDETINTLAASPSVIALQVDSMNLTDEGMSRLKAASQLRYLGIYGAALSAKCVPDLLGMRSIETIVLPSSAASDADASHGTNTSKIVFSSPDAKAPGQREFAKTVINLGYPRPTDQQ